MAEGLLLRSQRNQVFELVKEGGFDPSKFKWSVIRSKKTRLLSVNKLEYASSGFFFVFDILNAKHHCTYSPGQEAAVVTKYPGSWDFQLQHVSLWLSRLAKEVIEPDLWEEIAKSEIPRGAGIARETTNEPFSVAEIERITSALKEIGAYVDSLRIGTQEELTLVHERLDYLADAARRQGRKDWIHTCIGVLVTIATALALAPEQSGKMWELIKGALVGIIPFLPR